jgi:hypothetical protein
LGTQRSRKPAPTCQHEPLIHILFAKLCLLHHLSSSTTSSSAAAASSSSAWLSHLACALYASDSCRSSTLKFLNCCDERDPIETFVSGTVTITKPPKDALETPSFLAPIADCPEKSHTVRRRTNKFFPRRWLWRRRTSDCWIHDSSSSSWMILILHLKSPSSQNPLS